MANLQIHGGVGSYGNTTTSNVVDTVTFENIPDAVQVYGNGNSALYFTVIIDGVGADPTVGGEAAHELPANIYSSKVVNVPAEASTVVVKLISPGEVLYSVVRAED